MEIRYHSVVLDEEKCKGCTNCIKKCPTEAIRVRGGKAFILTERCLDCGECIRTCENHAKIAIGDTLAALDKYLYKVALPAPSLYAQFKPWFLPEQIIDALLKIGFDDVYEVAYAAEFTTYAIRSYVREYLNKNKNDRKHLPLISSSCPAVVRLIQLRFPGLIPNVIPIDPPYVTAAKLFHREHLPKLRIPAEKVGLFFITPCPAKITEVKTSRGELLVNGAIPISAIYGELKHALETSEVSGKKQRSSGVGIGWARAGGENAAVLIENAMSIDGIQNVASLLEEIELNKLSDIDYVEAMACPEGCVGGALTVENPFVARVKIRKLAERFKDKELNPKVSAYGAELTKESFFLSKQQLLAKPALQLDADLGTAIKKMEQLEEIMTTLPGLDCGACGSPTCRSLAEDIVQGQAQITDCIFLLREQLEDLAQKLLILAQKRPPAMGGTNKEEKKDEP